jgi:hypothetical protein
LLTFATPAFARVNDLSTPASSAFHRRARVSGGSLVDSPYDPFVGERRKDGEPERKRMRRSWGNDGRWRLKDQMPSPTKGTADSSWIADAERNSPEPPESELNRHSSEQLFSTITKRSTEAPEATLSEIEKMKSRLTQELVDMVGGDTEEDTDMEVQQAQASREVNEEIARDELEEPPLRRSQFAVFRDEESAQEVPEEPELRKSQFAVFRDEPTPQSARKQEASAERREVGDRASRPGQSHSPTEPNQQFIEPSLVHENAPTEDDSQVIGDELPTTPPVEYADFSSLMDPALLSNSFEAPQMPAPSLPFIQTSGFGFGFGSGQANPMEPPSALPRSPRTPDLRPQQSASLPLPSPFPGDNLATSYMDAAPSPQTPRSLFGSSMASSSTLPPDHLFGFGFGYGSGGLVQGLPSADNLTPSTGFEINRGALGEQVSYISPLEGQVSYPKLDLPTTSSFDLDLTSERTYTFSADTSTPMPIAGQEGPSPYPDNIPDAITERTVNLERTDDPAGYNAYKEFIQDQESDAILEQETLAHPQAHHVDDQHGEFQTEREADTVIHKETPHSTSIQSHPQPIPPDSSTPVVIDLLSSSEPSSDSDSEEGIETAKPESQIVDISGESEEEDEDEDSSARVSDRFSDDDSQVSLVQDDQSDSGGDSSSEDAEEYDSEHNEPHFQPPPPDTESRVRSYDGTFDSSPTVHITASHSEQLQISSPLSVAFSSMSSQSMFRSSQQNAPNLKPASPSRSSPHTSQPTHTQPPPLSPTRPIPFSASGSRKQAKVIDLDSINDKEEDDEEKEENEDEEENEEDEENEDASPREEFLPVGIEGSEEDTTMADADGEKEAEIERPAVIETATAFTPRVTRARAAAAANKQSTTQLELQSSAPLQPSQAVLAEDQSTRSDTQSYTTTYPPQSLRESNMPMTPDASQHVASQQTFQQAQQQSLLPPSPQMTQGTFNQSFREEYPGEDSATQNHGLHEVEGEPVHQISLESSQRRFGRPSDVPPALSSWFAPSRASESFVRSSMPVAQDFSNQRSETLKVDESLPSGSVPKTKNGISQLFEDSASVSANADASLRRRQSKDVFELSSHPSTSQPDPKESNSVNEEAENKDTLAAKLPSTYSISQAKQKQSKGLLTSISYYTPLSNLIKQLNVPASQSHHDPGIDILAVVSKPTTVPQRAEKGPRDYYTTFSVTDTSFWPQSISVQVFRPWKAALPKAEKGDAVLLRGFAVFSAKGTSGLGLRSGEGAAWCVWRVSFEDADGIDESGKPQWGNNRNGKSVSLREEVRGPPVEVGQEERKHVNELKKWWGELKMEEKNGSDETEHGESQQKAGLQD